MKKEAVCFRKVVIADDDPDHALLFSTVLNLVDASKELAIVKNGDQLMDLLQDMLPDVLFLDLNMPCKNGYDCLEQIRRDERLKQLPVIVYSSSSDIADIKKSFHYQADLYMVKAFNLQHLKNALETILAVGWWIKSLTGQRYYFMNNRFVPFTSV